MTSYGSILTAGYNGDGLRAWKQTASGRRYYLYDGEELVCELSAAGNVVTPVVFGANGLVVYSGTIYQFDPQGNAVHLLDDDGRTVLANLAYDAWGQLMSGSNPTPYGYKAQWGYHTDVETGILLLTHRYFDPAMGRFLTRDPIGLEGGMNLYAYVGNGVVNKVDPRGLMIQLPWPMELPCYHLPDGTCIGFCLFDPKCNPPKPGPKPGPPSYRPPRLPPRDVYICNPPPSQRPRYRPEPECWAMVPVPWATEFDVRRCEACCEESAKASQGSISAWDSNRLRRCKDECVRRGHMHFHL